MGLALAVTLLSAGACSSSTSSGSPEPGTAPTSALSTTEAATGADVELEFVRGVTSHTPEGVDAAARSTVPGSPAALYVDVERLRDEVRREAGEAPGAENVQRQSETVIMSYPLVGMYRAFTDFVFDGDLITSFSVASVPIDGQVVGPAGTATFGGDTYQIVGARIGGLGELSVVVQATGGSPGAVLPLEATLETSSGSLPSDANTSVPVTTTAPGASILAYYEFMRPTDAIAVNLRVCTQGTNECGVVTLPFVATQTA